MQTRPDGLARRQQRRRVRLGGQGAQAGQVIQDPEGAAMGADDQVIVLDLHVVHRHHRQPARHALPGGTIVQREEHAGFGAREQQPLPHGIGPHHAGDLALREVAVGRLPRAPAIAGAVQIGLVVAQLVARGGHVHRIGIMRARLHAADIGQLRQIGRRHVAPIVAAGALHMHQAIVGGGPDLALAMRALDHARGCGMHLGPGALAGDVAAGVALALLVVQRQVRRDRLPALALVGGFEHHVPARIQRVRIVRGEHDRECPAEAVFQVARRDTGGFLRPHVHQRDLVGLVVVALQRAGAAGAGAHRAAEHHVGVVRLHRDEPALAGAGVGAVAE